MIQKRHKSKQRKTPSKRGFPFYLGVVSVFCNHVGAEDDGAGVLGPEFEHLSRDFGIAALDFGQGAHPFTCGVAQVAGEVAAAADDLQGGHAGSLAALGSGVERADRDGQVAVDCGGLAIGRAGNVLIVRHVILLDVEQN